MARFPLGLKPCVEHKKTIVRSSPSCSILPNLLPRGVASQECKHSVAGLLSVSAVAAASQKGSSWVIPTLPSKVSSCVPQCSLTLGATGSPVGHPVSPTQTTPRLPLSPKGGSFDVSEIQIGNQKFDPASEMVKSQLTSKLGIGTCLSVDALHTGAGGCNQGMWIMRTSSQREFILKLVSANRQEGNKLSTLVRNHPSIVKDPLLAFPLQVFHVIGAGGTKRYDLIVMDKARGRTLADFLGSKWYSQGADPVKRVMKKLGSSLREFHTRYRNSQHGDFQPSNIFYDEASDKLTFIDVADIGANQAHHSDKQHLLESLRILSRAYGSKFLADASGAFEAGYAR